MKFGLTLAALLVICNVARGQPTSGFKWLKWDPSKLPLEVFDPDRPTDRYRLGTMNRTLTVWSAYRTDALVVVLGEMDSIIGEIVTVIDAGSTQELAEFLCNNAQPSESGRKIAFRHFYPHFGTAEISDRVQVIDFSKGVPPLIASADFHVPPEDAGMTVYPQTPLESGLRHRIQDFVWDTSETSLFFVDRIERVLPGKVEGVDVCLARVDQATSPSPPSLRSCLSARELGDDAITSITPTRFRRTPTGELLLSLELGGMPIESSNRDYNVDPATLKLSPAKAVDTQNYLPIPWSVQKKQLIAFTPVPSFEALKSHARDVVGVKLIIGIDGSVERAQMSNVLPEDVFDQLAAVITQWRFRPTILNGRRTKVITSFEVQPADLEDPGWASKDK